MADDTTSEPNDDVKAKYREALERKNKSSNRPTGGGTSKGSPGAHGEHAAESTKREFRRKSGG
jgi:hypothetical protein